MGALDRGLVVKPGRIPCINPRCRRTADAAKFGGEEIICGKCWRALPQAMRDEHRGNAKRWRKMERMIARRKAKGDIDPSTVDLITNRMMARNEAGWSKITSYFVTPAAPIGLEGFLQEMGMGG